jgi:hypothetical protein
MGYTSPLPGGKQFVFGSSAENKEEKLVKLCD